MNDRFKFRFFNKLSNEYENTYDLQSCEVLDYVIPEQCTGLKDKNGKLIYEGDIVKYIDYTCEVQFKKGCFVLEVIKGRKSGFFHFYDMHNSMLEIIGNIHENVDFLE